MDRPGKQGRPRLTPRRVAKMLMGMPIAAAALFGGAGRIDWLAGWIYLGLMTLALAAVAVVLVRFQPGLIEERGDRWPEGKAWDKPLVLVVAVLGPTIVQLICGLDERFGWSPPLDVPIRFVAALAILAGILFTAWAMSVNAFFSGVVRIQTDHGHVVVSAGPYRYLRHPGYTGAIVATMATPVLLGSVWGLIPAALVTAVIVLRTVLEDRTLRAELQGYAAYASRVRYRLLPGVW